jgi:hypothetical protein
MDTRTSWRIVSTSLVFSLGFANAAAIAQQCSHAQGEPWYDDYGQIWYLTQNGSSVSGGVWTACSWWDVSGSASNGTVDVTASNSWGWPECNDWFRYQGSIRAPGCDSGDGTWTNDLTATGNWGWVKACDTATSETTTLGYWSGPYHFFNATLNGSDGPDFAGRWFEETVAAPGSDGCWFSGSIYDPWTEVTAAGQPFVLGSDTWVDQIGWGPDMVTYYRQQQSAPCWTTLYQRMRLYCNTSGPDAYQDNTIYVNILETSLSVVRNGVSTGNHPY